MEETAETRAVVLIQQSARLQAKIAPMVMASALLQEAVVLNQQLVATVNTLLEELKNAKRPVQTHGPDARSVPDAA